RAGRRAPCPCRRPREDSHRAGRPWEPARWKPCPYDTALAPDLRTRCPNGYLRFELPPEIAFDLTPLQNAHGYRGIGTYVRGLAARLSQQSDIAIEFWAWDSDLPLRPLAPHTLRHITRPPMPEYRGAWMFARYAMRRLARQSQVKAIHVTDPDALTPLSGRRLLATVYDLIPLKAGVGRRRLLARRAYETYVRNLKHVDVLFAISEQT